MLINLRQFGTETVWTHSYRGWLLVVGWR